jgi:hypothetical protein
VLGLFLIESCGNVLLRAKRACCKYFIVKYSNTSYRFSYPGRALLEQLDAVEDLAMLV